MRPLRASLAAAAALLLAGGAATGQYLRVEVPIGPHDAEGTLHLYLFDARRMSFVVIDQGGPELPGYPNLAAAMQAHRCEAGCSGSPAAKSGEPLGLVIAAGKPSGQLERGRDDTAGVFFLDGSVPRLARAEAFKTNGTATPRHLVQSGPFLVIDKQVPAGLDDRRVARRTFVLTDGDDRWAIGYAPPTTLRQLAHALAASTTFKDFDVASALNLGGGSASALWIEREHGALSLNEVATARNFIGLVRR